MAEQLFELRQFSVATVDQYRELICHPAVTKHMPLAQKTYTNEWIRNWISSKESTWSDERLGPWSVWRDNEFAGWAGLEPEANDLSVGLVLHKKFWGNGQLILKLVFEKWQNYINERRVTVEFPRSRQSKIWASKLGLMPIEEIEIDGVAFVRYELPLNLIF